MTDVEKYGVFALVFVGLVLGLTLLQGAWDDPDGESAGAEDRAARPVIIRSASDVVDGRVLRPAAIQPVTLPRGGRGEKPTKQYTVRPLTSDRGAFDWDEAPVPYGGPRSALPPSNLPDGTRVHVIRKDETLGDISKHYFGTTTRWREFLDLNPGLDPKRLQVGQQLVVAAPGGVPPVLASAPPPRATAPVSSQGPRMYTVRKGDTLSEIAQREMGSAALSEELFRANADLLKSADQLKVGMALRIP